MTNPSKKVLTSAIEVLRLMIGSLRSSAEIHESSSGGPSELEVHHEAGHYGCSSWVERFEVAENIVRFLKKNGMIHQQPEWGGVKKYVWEISEKGERIAQGGKFQGRNGTP